MSVQLTVQYRNRPVTYNISAQESDVYQLRLGNPQHKEKKEYVPEKILIRKKGKIWVSDVEDYRELIQAIMAQISGFNENSGSYE
jgi:hypothetical protein